DGLIEGDPARVHRVQDEEEGHDLGQTGRRMGLVRVLFVQNLAGVGHHQDGRGRLHLKPLRGCPRPPKTQKKDQGDKEACPPHRSGTTHHHSPTSSWSASTKSAAGDPCKPIPSARHWASRATMKRKRRSSRAPAPMCPTRHRRPAISPTEPPINTPCS